MFRDFKQFKGIVKNYGIKHRLPYKRLPFILVGFTNGEGLVKDGTTMQVKSCVLKHEFEKEHRKRHVSAKWIAKAHMDNLGKIHHGDWYG